MSSYHQIKRRTAASAFCALALAGFCACTSPSSQEIKWLSYERTVVELEGKLAVEAHFGPPGFGDNPNTDEKANVPVLVLQKPVSVRGDPKSDMNTGSVEGITRIQLVFNTTSPAHKTLIGSAVIVKGTLFEAHAGHHYTDVLLTVQDIRKQPRVGEGTQSTNHLTAPVPVVHNIKDEFATLKNALSQNTISKIVVLRMPDYMEFYTALTPQQLRKFGPPARKFTIEMNDARATLLKEWIQQAKFTPREHSPDCRWGLLFMDRNGKEVTSIFSDAFGLGGNVEGRNLEFTDRRLLDTLHGVVGAEEP